LDGPSSAGICNAIRLLSSNSRGAGARTLKYEYAVSSATGQSALAQAAIDRQNPNGTSTDIFIGATDMDIGSTYTFTLTVTNFLSSVSSVSLDVTKLDTSFAQVTILGITPMQIRMNELVSLVTRTVVPFKCDASISQQSDSTFQYTWTVQSGRPIDFAVVRGRTTPVLTIPAGTLEFGQTYVFIVTVSHSVLLSCPRRSERKCFVSGQCVGSTFASHRFVSCGVRYLAFRACIPFPLMSSVRAVCSSIVSRCSVGYCVAHLRNCSDTHR
jgi:hypothetical protein